MHIVTVYPIVKGAFREELTYWSSHTFSVGSIIEVPLRGRNIPALVSEVTPATHAKSQIKQASFITRKIEKTKELHVVHTECIRASLDISQKYVASLGSILKACIPESILQSRIDSKKKYGPLERGPKDSKSNLNGLLASSMLVIKTIKVTARESPIMID